MQSTIDWKDQMSNWPGKLPEFDVEPRSTALLLVDIQYYHTHRDFGIAKIFEQQFPALAAAYFDRIERTVIPANQRLLKFFRSHGLRVIFITVGPNLADGSDMFARRRRRDEARRRATGAANTFFVGSPEHRVRDEVAPLPGELVLNKNSIGAFNSTALDQMLRNFGVESLVLTGVATNACVETTARDAADRGYNCILAEDGCATMDEPSHIATLLSFGRLFGKVSTADETIALLQALISEPAPRA
jgi:nicotinamidase-related amidase